MDHPCLKYYMPPISWHRDAVENEIVSIDIQQQDALKTLIFEEEEKKKKGSVEVLAIDDAKVSEEDCGEKMEIDGETPSVIIEPSKPGTSYKIATANPRDIRIWEFHFEPEKKEGQEPTTALRVNFIANIRNNQPSSLSVVRFSPNGMLLAVGDTDGCVNIYRLRGREKELLDAQVKDNGDEYVLPPNKENWAKEAAYYHDSDPMVRNVTAVSFSPDSTMVASLSMDRTVIGYNIKKKKAEWKVSSFRYIASGVSWDPRGKYIVTLASNRYFDVNDALKGTRLQNCCQVTLPDTSLDSETLIPQKVYKLFHDDQLMAFCRGVEWSPCGSLVVAPAAYIDLGERHLNGCYVFKRESLKECKPTAMFPTRKPTILVKFSPVVYKLRDGDCNFLDLPHRVVWAVMCKSSVMLYDSQHSAPLSYIGNIQQVDLTSIAWTPDGKVLVVSSLEGYNTFISIAGDVLGEVESDYSFFPQMDLPNMISAPDSPKLRKEKKKRALKKESKTETVETIPTMKEGTTLPNVETEAIC